MISREAVVCLRALGEKEEDAILSHRQVKPYPVEIPIMSGMAHPDAQLVTVAVFREGEASARLESATLGDFRADEVLVKLVATGVCHTDLICRDGFLPLQRPVVLGHEGAGVVVQVGGDVTSVVPGDSVVMSFLPCGTCRPCLEGRLAYCEAFMANNFSGRRADGSSGLSVAGEAISAHFFSQSSFASHSVANERNVIKVRSDAPLELLGPLGCGVQTGAGAVMNVLQPSAGTSFAVFGAGGVGLSAVMAAAVLGCHPIIVVEPNAERRALALEVGATHAIDPSDDEDRVAQLRALSGGGVEYALDTCGIPSVIGQAIEALASRGHLALVTGNSLEAVLPIHLLSIVSRGVTLRGVNMGDSVPQTFIPKLVDLIVDGRFPIAKLARFYDFDDINQALHDQECGSAVKPILRMPSSVP